MGRAGNFRRKKKTCLKKPGARWSVLSQETGDSDENQATKSSKGGPREKERAVGATKGGRSKNMGPRAVPAFGGRGTGQRKKKDV